MAFLGFNVNIPATALVAATAKSVVSVVAAANQVVLVKEIIITHDGSTSTAVPVTIELCRSTQAGAGTATTATPVKRDPGRAETIQSVCKTNFTAEPTTLTAFETIYVPAYNGGVQQPIPLLNPVVIAGGAGFVVRATAPANVNLSGSLLCEE